MTDATGCRAIRTMPLTAAVSVGCIELLAGYASTFYVYGSATVGAC